VQLCVDFARINNDICALALEVWTRSTGPALPRLCLVRDPEDQEAKGLGTVPVQGRLVFCSHGFSLRRIYNWN
jgi:hypothetical protein